MNPDDIRDVEYASVRAMVKHAHPLSKFSHDGSARNGDLLIRCSCGWEWSK